MKNLGDREARNIFKFELLTAEGILDGSPSGEVIKPTDSFPAVLDSPSRTSAASFGSE